MKSVALNIGFPGAGRVVYELANISGGKVEYREAYHFTWKDADLMFLPAWHPQYENLISKKKVIVWTSPIIQSEYTLIEFQYLSRILKLLDEGKIYAVWFGSKDWLPYAKKEGRRVFYCPYPVTLPSTWRQQPSKNPPMDVGLFGPLGPRKNVAVQAMATKKAGCNLHITDDGAAPILHSLGILHAGHGWVIPSRYHDLVCAMDVGLQCSVPGSESFSYVTWDFLSRDVPCLSTVDWVLDFSGLYVDKPYDINYLVDRIRAAAYLFNPGQLRKYAEEFAASRNETVKKTLKEELEDLDL